MAVASWLRVSPFVIVIAVAAPVPNCKEKLPADSPVLLLATAEAEYHEAVVASLLTFTT